MEKIITLWNSRVKKADLETGKVYVECLKEHLAQVEANKKAVKLERLPPREIFDYTIMDNEHDEFGEELNFLLRKSRYEGVTYEEKARMRILYEQWRLDASQAKAYRGARAGKSG